MTFVPTDATTTCMRDDVRLDPYSRSSSGSAFRIPSRATPAAFATSEATAALRRREFDFLPFSVFGTLTGTAASMPRDSRGDSEAPLPG